MLDASVVRYIRRASFILVIHTGNVRPASMTCSVDLRIAVYVIAISRVGNATRLRGTYT